MPAPDRPPMRPPDGPRLRQVERLLRSGVSAPDVDRLTKLAAELLDAPLAQMSLLAQDELEWSRYTARSGGQEVGTTPLVESLCTVTAYSGEVLSVSEALTDTRVSSLPPVTSGQVRSYLGVPLLGHDGVVLGALCVFDDRPRTWPAQAAWILGELAHSVVAQLELRALTAEAGEDAARLELALEAADIGSFDLDVATGRLVWDDRLIRLFGFDPSTFVQRLSSFYDGLHPEDVPRLAEAIEHTVQRSGELSTEYRVVRPDGTVRWVEARGRVLGVEGAQRLLGVAYDSTELRTARDRLSRLLETMTDAFFSVGPDWRFTYVNRQAEQLLARRRDELLGAVLWEEFPEALGSPFEEQYRGAVERDEPVMFEAPYAPLGGFYEVSAWPGADGLSVYFRDVSARRLAEAERERASGEREQAVVERERAYASAQAANQRLQLLADASTRLAATLQPQEVLQAVSDLVVPGLGQWLAVLLTADTAAALTGSEVLGDPASLSLVHVSSSDPGQEDALRRVSGGLRLSTDDPTGIGVVVRTGRAEWLPVASAEGLVGTAAHSRPGALDELRALGITSALSLPLLNRGRAIGAVVVGEPHGDRIDRGLLESIAGRTAVALDNALLYRQQQRTAITLQRSLLPRELPKVPGVASAARYLPGATGAFVGGDWYQGVRVGNRLVLAMGDVMGHGMRSAARMGQLRAIVATLALEGHGPRGLLERLARNCDVLLDLELATLLVAVLDPATGLLTVASAGHPPPLLAPVGLPPGYLDVEPGPPLGTLPGSYPETAVQLTPGSTLVLYTDGLVELRSAPLDEGLERLRTSVAGLALGPEELADHVLARLDREYGGEDDVALLVLEWTP